MVILEVIADYAAMLLLVHLTGGASSPLALFLIFHVIVGAVQFSPGTAHLFAALAAAGLWAIHGLNVAGWLANRGLSFRGQPLHQLDRPAQATVFLLVFTATLFLTATMVSRIMRQLRRRVDELGAASAELADLNTRLNGLYTMVRAIGAERHLAPKLEAVARELAHVTDVPAAAVKLLSDDGKTLRYVAAYGLPASWSRRLSSGSIRARSTGASSTAKPWCTAASAAIPHSNTRASSPRSASARRCWRRSRSGRG